MIRRCLSSILILAFVGCGSTAGTLATLDTGTGEKKIMPQQAGFAQKVKVEDIIYRETGGLIEAQVKLTNQSGKSIAVEVMAKWYDNNGFEIADPKELWRHVIINGKETKAVKFVAPRKDAVKLEVLSREGKFKDNY
jgi:uncharacterized protein YcfL